MNNTINTQEQPRIYVACLAAYNNGRLHGKWIKCEDEEQIKEEIQGMLKNSPVADTEDCEEWAIHDYDNFHSIRLSEYESIKNIALIAEKINEHGEAVSVFIDYIGGIEYFNDSDFEDAFQGEWENEEDFAYNLMNDCYEIPNYLEYYIDYEKYANDLFINDYYSENLSNGNIIVFRRI